MLEIAELEQAIAVANWRLSPDYSDIRWSVGVTDLASVDGNLDRYGYLIN